MSEIQDDEQAYLKRWYKFAKIHKSIQPPRKDIHLESLCYRIKIRDVSNISPKKDNAVKFYNYLSFIELQQDRQVSAINLAMDFQNKLKIDKQKEQEYQKMVETIKKQHEEEIQKILEQYEDLKKMMTDTVDDVKDCPTILTVHHINQTQQQYLTNAQPTSASLLGQQQVLQDQKELEKWRIIESMTSVPRKTFYQTQQQDLMVEAQFGGQALSRGDIAFLSQNGITLKMIKLIKYGTIRLPLRQLLRQGQYASVAMRKAEIINKEFKKIKGELQVLIKCVGKEDRVTEVFDNNSQMKRNLAFAYFRGGRQGLNQRIKEQEDKKFPMVQITIVLNHLWKQPKRNNLSKNAFVHSVFQSHLSDEKVIHPYFWKVEIIELESEIHMRLDKTLQSAQMIKNLNHQPVEWEYYVDLYNHSKSQEFNMIQANQNNFTMFLTTMEKVILLFKNQTFREVNQEYTELQKTEELYTIKGKQFLTQYSYPRQVAVFINTIEGQCVGGMRIKIFLHYNSTDHVIDSTNETINNSLWIYNTAPDKRPIQFCNNEELIANWQIKLASLAGNGIEVPLGQVQNIKLAVHVEISRQVKFYSSHPICVWFPQPYDQLVNLIPGKSIQLIYV
ncbi:unnamed protein product [Paramecium octaurelia]|uniref:Uncharacterized protein n=1 Tax=Paramecium octaurelia TaxID=43137 RepID=A0A8S1VIW8_PAROT|nr:unnamed protein product [Paramecium octaurelia]